MMKIRQAIDQYTARNFNTKQLRESFLIDRLFDDGKVNLTYSHYDRLIVGGASPEKELALDVDRHIIGTDYFLERREMAAINVGGPGSITVDGQAFKLEWLDCLYLGMGAKAISFTSDSPAARSKFYINSAPAHKQYPNTKISRMESAPVQLGAAENSNTRTIFKYIHPEGVKSCQLVMGVTLLEPNNIWNTMPVHTHERRMEAYFYFNLPGEEVVFHIMGEPAETRHILVRNEQAVLSPSWSIHSGVGTHNYAFIWGMAGENQIFSDMDAIDMSTLM
jgi:4-deoxy-L-threo-5-hexosulose-uronate ketol-isomerase